MATMSSGSPAMSLERCLCLILLWTIVWLPATFCSNGLPLEEKLTAVHSSLSSEIAFLKGQLLIHVLPELKRLKRTPCHCTKAANDDIQYSKETTVEDYIIEIERRMTLFATAFMNEKMAARSVADTMEHFKETMEANNRDQSMIIRSTKESSGQNKLSITEQTAQIADIQSTAEGLMNMTNHLSDKINNVSNHVEHVCKAPGDGLKPPSFISEWFVMKSQNATFCERIIAHGLTKIPAKVDVQIKPLQGADNHDNEWICTGDSVLQSDDDKGTEYGGVVYFYNETHVILKVPMKNNGQTSGILLTTGGDGDRFVHEDGDQYRFSEALVRVRIWLNEDLPDAAFTSDWLPLAIYDTNKVFYELSHGLSAYPALVTVQIKSSQGLISEAMGAVMTPFLKTLFWSNAGGVAYGYDDKTVRIWGAYVSPEQRSDNRVLFGKLFGTVDGWGNSGIGKPVNGHMKVTAWSTESFILNKQLHGYVGNAQQGYVASNKPIAADVDNDLMTFHVQALDGPNRGFLFKGYGSSQSQEEPFGGAIFAYNKDGVVKIWKPKVEVNGYLIHINSPYGNGKLNQASNAAAFRVILLKGVS